MTHPLLAALVATRVVPVVRTASTRHAETAVAWLREVGFTTFEITMSVPDAPGLIRTLATEPGLLVPPTLICVAVVPTKCQNVPLLVMTSAGRSGLSKSDAELGANW